MRIGICAHKIEGEFVEISIWTLDPETLKHVSEMRAPGAPRKWIRIHYTDELGDGDTLVLPDEVTL